MTSLRRTAADGRRLQTYCAIQSPVRGAEDVARRARSFSQTGLLRHPVLVNGVAGAICVLDGKPFSVMAFTVSGGKIVEIHVLRDADRLSQIDLTTLDHDEHVFPRRLSGI